MPGAYEFLKALATVLCVAGLITVACHRLRQPVVLGYLLAGLIVGPHVPIPLVADPEIVRTLSELGVILLMFALGLEFRLRDLARVGASGAVTALVQFSLLLWLGSSVGELFGWPLGDRLVAGGMIAISSTTIIAKVFDEQGVRGRLRELVIGVLIVEDLLAVLLLTALPLIARGGLSASAIAGTSLRLIALLAGVVALGLAIVPRAMRAVVRLRRPETTLVTSVGICFALAVIAHALGYSVALGAFVAGSLIAESGEAQVVERLVQPVKDLFAAVFFVSVGMLFDPALMSLHWPAVLALTAAVLVGNFVGVTAGAFLTGNGTRTSLQAAMSLAQIGEFSFIIAALGISLGFAREFLYPVAVAVSALTTLGTPWLVRGSARVAAFVDRKLPHRMQTFAALYGSWIERMQRTPASARSRAPTRRLASLLALDAGLLACLALGAALTVDDLSAVLSRGLGLTPALARGLVIGAALALAVPLGFGVVRIARQIGIALADLALPHAAPGALDLGAAPRGALVATIQLAVVLVVAVLLLAITQPVLSASLSALSLMLVLVFLVAAFLRSTRDLQGHVRAGAEVIVEALAAQTRGPQAAALRGPGEANQLFSGLGEPRPIRLREGSPAAGRTLGELDLRGLTGATVLAIQRGSQSVALPAASEVLRDGDVLAIAGTHDAVNAAAQLLERGKAAEAP